MAEFRSSTCHWAGPDFGVRKHVMSPYWGRKFLSFVAGSPQLAAAGRDTLKFIHCDLQGLQCRSGLDRISSVSSDVAYFLCKISTLAFSRSVVSVMWFKKLSGNFTISRLDKWGGIVPSFVGAA
jgi:hypothetical protein